GHDPVTHALQKANRIVAADGGVRRIVLHPEIRRLDPAENLEKDVFRLCELGIAPQAILVVVLEAERHAAALGMLQALLNAIDGAVDAVLTAQAGIALTAERAAEPPTQPH